MTESLKKQNEALRAQLKKAQEQLERQAATIKQLQEIIFGKKTEVLEQVADGQLSLFDPVDDLNLDQEITEVVKTTTTKVVRHRPAKKQLTRQEVFRPTSSSRGSCFFKNDCLSRLSAQNGSYWKTIGTTGS